MDPVLTRLTDVFNRQPIIRRKVFSKLPREVILEYASHYGIPNPNILASSEICNLLYSRGTKVRALQQHVQHHTRTGVVVAQNIKDLEAWLSEHHSMNLDADSSDEDNHDVPALAVPHRRKDIKTRLFDIFMELLAGWAGFEVANMIADVARYFGRKYLGSAERPLKRTREDEHEPEGSRCRKRARQESGYLNSSNVVVDDRILWADYVCDDSDASDSDYAPSIGTSEEDDDVDMSPEELREIMEYRSYNDGGYISGDLSSEEHTEVYPGNQSNILWKDCPSDEESDSDDLDYVPPRWTFEHVLEIGTKTKCGTRDYKTLDSFRHADEVIKHGPLSDAGISDSDGDGSDSDSGEHFLDLPTHKTKIPAHVGKYSTLPAYYTSTGGPTLFDYRTNNSEWYSMHASYLIKQVKYRKVQDPNWDICDMDARIERVLTDDHLQYAFDDVAWKALEDPRRLKRPRG